MPWRAPLAERVAAGLPNALIMVGVYLAATLIWIEFQWPPARLVEIVMMVVIVGVQIMLEIPAQQPERRLAIGAAAGLLVTATLYVLVLPRLSAFTELALVLFPFYFVITYFMHALPSPRHIPFLGMGLTGILMLQLQPVQSIDVAGWVGVGISVLFGFTIALVPLGIFCGVTPQKQLRRLLRGLFEDLQGVITALADSGRPDFSRVLGETEQRLLPRLKALDQVVSLAYTTRVLHNDPERIRTLHEATESTLLRVRALEHARA